MLTENHGEKKVAENILGGGPGSRPIKEERQLGTIACRPRWVTHTLARTHARKQAHAAPCRLTFPRVRSENSPQSTET